MTEAYRNTARVLAIAACLVLLGPLATAPAEEAAPQAHSQASSGSEPGHDQPAKPDNEAVAADLLPATSHTEHTITLSGESLHYAATAGTLPARDPDGKTLGSIFYVAYARAPADAKRPITFVFNGGPGAASAYLHLGALGPKTIAVSAKGECTVLLPGLADNDSHPGSISPTSYSSIQSAPAIVVPAPARTSAISSVSSTTPKSSLISSALFSSTTARMISPVFLAGESYGGFRVATITRELQKKGGVSPSGLVLISPALEFALLNGEDYDPLSWALSLPSYAAVNFGEQRRHRARSAWRRAQGCRALCAVGLPRRSRFRR